MDAQPQEEEPNSPMWLPVLGIALFLVAGIYWATRPVPVPPPALDIVAPVASSAPAPPPVASAPSSAMPMRIPQRPPPRQR